ncbi:jg2368 [Pararge aegeria aegeria]|uniref:Jg2368 protein n=1 Tax=Pararge aegeria aegeria TaxID=348720 RepID=A0A8S4S989_9NEOP|nr:jg2368 [Pararge aegeria aegeria]
MQVKSSATCNLVSIRGIEVKPHHVNQSSSTAGHRSFVESSTIHGPGPLASSGSAAVKPHVPVITPALTPFRSELTIVVMLLSGRNKHGYSTSPDELSQIALLLQSHHPTS